MNRSALVGLAIVAVAAVSCGGDHSPVEAAPVDVPELLARAGHSWADDISASTPAIRELVCKDDVWFPEIYSDPLGRPRIERMVFVAWDMPAGTFRGWDLVQNAADRHTWSAALSAEEVGFGCDERFTTGFFFLTSWPENNVSVPVGFQRAEHGAFSESIRSDDGVLVEHSTWIDSDMANVPGPDKATFYLQNLFTGATFSTDVPTEHDLDGSPDYYAALDVDYGELGLGAMTDVVAGVAYKRDGAEVMNQCLTVLATSLP
ncbi:hypothetical protein [Sorangium cellulosum]|uniref:Uncharacterized protein n=1 Tax=Sorangium cellulosum TaxID=56 RepID=A0A150Q8X8_SORCE|nr:hypothetical protein [Sorangium cellulosum]KYF64363.1 hypothetical protein BE15_29605 [Sorangium cellulosum]